MKQTRRLPAANPIFVVLTTLSTALSCATGGAVKAQSPAEGIAFFEQNIRPLLSQKCYACHSEKAGKPQGGLLLDSAEGWKRGGAGGEAITPKDPAQSRLLLAVRHLRGAPAMPPGSRLSNREIALLEEWIRKGAPDPRKGKAPAKQGKSFSERQALWSFQPLKQTPLPKVKQNAWCITPIDRFILAKLEAKGMKPSPPAAKRVLLRRLSYDLTGLPPAPQETAAFLADASPNAYEKAVERLLASPRYGERWARHWLDVAHYGDTHGYDKDKRRDNAWRYRDYVIRAFNEDKPYQRFLKEQIAGDALFPNDPQGIVATGFLAAGPWDFVGNVELAEGTLEKAKTRVLDRDDIVTSVMTTFNSVTIHCARCHDHKFDPITQKDYYRLQAVFAGADRGDRPFGEGGTEPTAMGSPTNGYHSAIEPKPDVAKWVQIDLGASASIGSIRLLPARPTDFADTPGFGFPVRFRVQISETPDFQNAITLADHTTEDFPNPQEKPVTIAGGEQRGRYVRITAQRLWKRTNDYVFALGEAQVFSGNRNIALRAKVEASDSIEQGRWSARYLTDGSDSRRSFVAQTYAITPKKPSPVYVLLRGEADKPKEIAEPGSLSCLKGLPAKFALSEEEDESRRRIALAEWLASPQNPLTWRSIVNRVWGAHFGKGIVDTPSDFGWNGSRPTHPELLDWLALWFQSQGQSIKKLHRLIVTSAAYRQSSQSRADYAKIDSDNRLLWRMNRRRLDAEEVRDATLAVSGSLNLTMGGPGFELFRFKDDHSPIYDHSAIDRINDPRNWRRTIYRFTVRSVPNPFLDSLDAADPNINVATRNATLTALQALALLNNPFMVKQSERFAERLRGENAAPERQIEGAFRLAFGRPPTPQESAEAMGYAKSYGLANLCRLLLNANEFVFLD